MYIGTAQSVTWKPHWEYVPVSSVCVVRSSGRSDTSTRKVWSFCTDELNEYEELKVMAGMGKLELDSRK
jgi:hypothetical protein